MRWDIKVDRAIKTGMHNIIDSAAVYIIYH